MLQKLQIAFVQVKVGNIPENLLKDSYKRAIKLLLYSRILRIIKHLILKDYYLTSQIKQVKKKCFICCFIKS